MVRGAGIAVRRGKVVQKSIGDHLRTRIGDTPGITAPDAFVGGLGEQAYPAAATALGFLSR
ncbi:hypothetical protein GCM10010178_50610 [Lentzea flava]|uniref:Uncharacterized protein n=1 Tax=Lentzea flava TaxID=103732 RepID=A0ABQ2USR1_9PSEU|nr:hypothetical protein GCM10010178_50610 [Lentzea flava]